ncbi:uncharacterized protein [Macrobrachium rosenbergii]|uniref:uncharacterized protein n=1 Tax=Macrobrachium rosenbergii TaxID=79674 RepID=UPI0034D6E09C
MSALQSHPYRRCRSSAAIRGHQIPPDGHRPFHTVAGSNPMKEVLTSACAKALLSSWISRFSVPDSITTDRGPAFLSELWVALACLMGTTLHSTTAYNPAANGMVERAHRSLKASLMACCINDNWKAQLPWVLLGLLTTPRAEGEVSPAEKVYSETLACSRRVLRHGTRQRRYLTSKAEGSGTEVHALTKDFHGQDPRLQPWGSGYLHLCLHQDRRPPPTLDQTVQGPILCCQEIIQGLSHQHPRV